MTRDLEVRLEAWRMSQRAVPGPVLVFPLLRVRGVLVVEGGGPGVVAQERSASSRGLSPSSGQLTRPSQKYFLRMK